MSFYILKLQDKNYDLLSYDNNNNSFFYCTRNFNINEAIYNVFCT